MPKRLFVCSAIVLIVAVAALPAVAQDSEQTDRAPTLNIGLWELFSTFWSNLFSGSEPAPPRDPVDDTPALEQPSDDQCSGTDEKCAGTTGGGSGGHTEQVPIGDPNG